MNSWICAKLCPHYVYNYMTDCATIEYMIYAFKGLYHGHLKHLGPWTLVHSDTWGT